MEALERLERDLLIAEDQLSKFHLTWIDTNRILSGPTRIFEYATFIASPGFWLYLSSVVKSIKDITTEIEEISPLSSSDWYD
jgi:hypothetical protein